MKKKILLISGIVIFVALIAFYVAKVAFVEANKDSKVNVEMSEEEVKDLYNMPQPQKENKEYEKLTDEEIKAFEKYYTLGDVTNDKIIDTTDAQNALEIYTRTVLSGQRAQTKGEIFTADIDRDGVVKVDDAQILLKYSVYKPLNEDITLEKYIADELYKK